MIKKYDLWLVFFIIALILFGCFMVLSSSMVMADNRGSYPYSFFFRQLFYVVLGFIIAYITCLRIDYHSYQKQAKLFYILALLSLIFVLIFGVSRGGATRWISVFGLFTIQPSELVKIVIVISIADFISKKQKELNLKYNVLIAFATIIIAAGLIVANDLGTPALIVIVSLIMLFCAGMDKKIIGGAFIALVFSAAIFILAAPYRFLRVKSYILSFLGNDFASYQLKQSINALGSGGLFGKGIGKSDLKLMYLPEAHTDFIFPIIGEELGFIGAFVIIVLFVLIYIRGIRISRNAPDIFSRYLALGLTLMLVLPAISNILIVIGLAPTKGLVLPFISFGGTAMISSMIAGGILLNISQYTRRK